MIDHEKRTRRRKICEANDFSDADDPIAPPPHRILRHHYRATKIQLAGVNILPFFQDFREKVFKKVRGRPEFELRTRKLACHCCLLKF